MTNYLIASIGLNTNSLGKDITPIKYMFPLRLLKLFLHLFHNNMLFVKVLSKHAQCVNLRDVTAIV